MFVLIVSSVAQHYPIFQKHFEKKKSIHEQKEYVVCSGIFFSLWAHSMLNAHAPDLVRFFTKVLVCTEATVIERHPILRTLIESNKILWGPHRTCWGHFIDVEEITDFFDVGFYVGHFTCYLQLHVMQLIFIYAPFRHSINFDGCMEYDSPTGQTVSVWNFVGS